MRNLKFIFFVSLILFAFMLLLVLQVHLDLQPRGYACLRTLKAQT